MSTINRFVSALVFCGLLLLGSRHLAAGTYYVTTSGNDTNTGKSQTLAWRTIGHAVATAVAGDTVYIKAGLYAKEPTINGGRINMGAYGNTAQASKTGRAPTRPTGRNLAVPASRPSQ